MNESFDGFWQDKKVRSSLILTDTYVAGTVIEIPESFNQLNLLVDFTKGDLTTCELKIEYSLDGLGYYQKNTVSYSDGIATLEPLEYQMDTTRKAVIEVNVKYKYAKVWIKGTGTVTNSLAAITAVVGNA